MAEEILVVNPTTKGMEFNITSNKNGPWASRQIAKTYKKIVRSNDPNDLAFLFYDLWTQGYPIEKAYNKFKEFINDKEGLFFTK